MNKLIKTPKEVLKSIWGYSEFKPIQEEIINSIINWSDTIAILATGYWKSICYQVSSQIFDWLSIIISPLLSLMEDQVDNIDRLNEIKELEQHWIKALYINSLLDPKEKKENILKILAGEIKLLYISPERFCNDWFIEILRNIPISQIVIDEAHCIKQYWESWFRNAYNKLWIYIEELKKTNKSEQDWSKKNIIISAFTGTATKETEEMIKSVLKMNCPNEFKTKSTRDNFYIYTTYEDTKKEAEEKLLKLCLSLQNINWKVLIFPWTIKGTKEISSLLKSAELESAHFHSELSVTRKKSLQKKFKDWDIKFLIATSAFWMWIDIPDIRVVIHFCTPLDLESYVQEIWRAGRDWKESLAVLITCWKDIVTSKFMLTWKTNYYKSLEELNKMIDFIKNEDICKQKIISSYFWKDDETICKKCSSC